MSPELGAVFAPITFFDVKAAAVTAHQFVDQLFERRFERRVVVGRRMQIHFGIEFVDACACELLGAVTEEGGECGIGIQDSAV